MAKPIYQPLAARLRPQNIEECVGQAHLLKPGKPLFQAWEKRSLHSMILWGPPGTGKTTLARLFADRIDAQFYTLSAVLSGVKDIRAVVDQARLDQQAGKKSILFVDEIHRFNKAQQDAFLPHVEDGTLILIGATTENPSFELNNALLSRARVYLLKALQEEDLLKIIDRALLDKDWGLGHLQINFPPQLKLQLAQVADGDARRCLNLLEIISDLVDEGQTITVEMMQQALGEAYRRFDKGGDLFYDQISALHKAVRGSSPDGALYWLVRMLDGGCDPLYIARRTVRMASEDIGNADPRALTLALNAWDIVERLGQPEGELALAQAIVYLACAAKSNAVYLAHKAAIQDAKSSGTAEVPSHLRNAPTQLLKKLGHGAAYRYDHDEPNAFAAGQTYFPETLGERVYYQPNERGLEIQIAEKLAALRKVKNSRR